VHDLAVIVQLVLPCEQRCQREKTRSWIEHLVGFEVLNALLNRYIFKFVLDPMWCFNIRGPFKMGWPFCRLISSSVDITKKIAP
jgi:hypothetical protein